MPFIEIKAKFIKNVSNHSKKAQIVTMKIFFHYSDFIIFCFQRKKIFQISFPSFIHFLLRRQLWDWNDSLLLSFPFLSFLSLFLFLFLSLHSSLLKENRLYVFCFFFCFCFFIPLYYVSENRLSVFLFLFLYSSLLKENWLYVFCFFFFIPLYWKKIDCMYFVSVSLLLFTKRKSIVCILSLFLYYSLLKRIVCVSVSFLKGK